MSRRHLIWIDLSNSPHVLFFRPVIAELHRRGYRVVVTARDFAQTRAMCELYGVPHTTLGVHGGASLPGKAANFVARTRQLNAYVDAVRPDAVISHNSYPQLAVARLRRLPSVTTMDYEYQPANHLAFRFASAVFVPQAFPDRQLRRCGASRSKVWKYPGLKEHISLAGFVPDPGLRSSLGISDDERLVVVRPPAEFALYHRLDNLLFPDLVAHLRDRSAVRVLIVPRTVTQAADLRAKGFGDLLWDGPVLDGPNLICAADLVVTAGGTMAREAAVLGTPSCSVYAGRLAAVDRSLERRGLLHVVRTREDVARVHVLANRTPRRGPVGHGPVEDLVDHAEAAWRRDGLRA